MRTLLLLVMLLSACAPRATESDAFVPSDAFAIAPLDAPSCSLSPPDALLALGGDVVALDVDGGVRIPAQDGGDPIGVWRVEHVTIYAHGDVDTSASVTGTAWLVVTPSAVQASLDLTIGTQHDTLALSGSYTTSGVTIHVAGGCGPPIDIDFTSGDSSGTLRMMLGDETLLMHCARTST